jgi:hypothetical protein
LAVVSAGLVWLWQRYADRDRRASHAPFAALFAAAVCGLLAHVLMDYPTSYGTRLFSPFDWHWYATDVMPIVDVYLLAVLGGGLIIGHRRPAHRRQAAAVAIAFTLLNYGVRAGAHQWALAAAADTMAPLLPPRCPDSVPPSLFSHWPRAGKADPHPRGAAPHNAGAACLVEIAAIPTFLSPLRWQVIARSSDAYQMLELNLLSRVTAAPERPVNNDNSDNSDNSDNGDNGDAGDAASGFDAPWRDAVHYPDQWTANVWRAADTDLARVFLGFSRFPAARSGLQEDRSAMVSWTDMRFVGTPVRRPGNGGMFAATVTLGPDGRVLSTQLGE